jgi:enolase
MIALKALKARQVLDSRGRPTVEVEAITSTGLVGRAIVPSGASTGRHEALELRDAGNPRYGGLGVVGAVDHVTREIAPAVAGMDLEDQAGLDARLIAIDGTPNKSRLGANALLGVSLAAAHAAAIARGEELFVHLNRLCRTATASANPEAVAVEPTLPMPMVNMISGGLHAGGNLDIQDVLIIPIGAASYSEALEMAIALYRAVGAVLKERGFESDLVGDEGGYGPRLHGNEQAFEVVVDAMIACGFEPGRDVAIAVDVASTHFFDPDRGTYRLGAEGGRELDAPAMIDLLADWVGRYPIVSIEDGLAEDDWDGWAALTARLGDSVQLIGDDLFATQVDRLRQGIDRRAGNAILIKLNQVGTLTETLDALRLAREHGFRAVVSARSGETEDTTIADLAVATAAGQIKIGSVARSERLAKYNRLLRIEEALGPGACLARPFIPQRVQD